MDNSSQVDILQTDCYNSSFSDAIWLGVGSCLPVELPKVENSEVDDGYYINVTNEKGMISGINDRSVLLAVYRYLSQLGCTWVRPGKDGDIIPKKDLSFTSVTISEKASYRHRGVCIEGAVSYEHVTDMIDWLPKVGMNAYFNQFMVPFTFFDRWYSHKSNPYLDPIPTSVEEVACMVNQCEAEIEKRGLLYHKAGHGWTCNPFGIEGNSWDTKDYFVPEESKQLLAMVDGKRELWKGIPLDTNLCYSNPIVVEGITDAIANYCEEYSNVDYLHFWLADGYNNHCECENCRTTLPSDFYVMMLNRLDEKLIQKGLRTKIVFLIYFDLLWTPQHEKLINQDRFVLMFAPITRTYTHAYKVDESEAGIGVNPYERNKLIMPRSIGENLAYLRDWQQYFDADSFDFDYHFMWDHYRDPGYYRLAEILFQDIKNLKHIGLNGLMSCQTQRSFFPTGLGMYIMAKTLWDDNKDFQELVDEYFAAGYGEDGNKVGLYLEKLSELFDPPYLRLEKEIVNDGSALRYKEIPKFIQSFAPVIERNLDVVSDMSIKRSWEYLKYHAEICRKLSSVLAEKASGNQDLALKEWNELKDYTQKNEVNFHRVFDVHLFINVLNKVIGTSKRPNVFL